MLNHSCFKATEIFVTNRQTHSIPLSPSERGIISNEESCQGIYSKQIVMNLDNYFFTLYII